MKKFIWLLSFLMLHKHQVVLAQSDQHYTMFMYNKMLFNPAYTGSRDVASVNGLYRNQWTGMPGAPITMNLSADGPVGSYMRPFRKVATGLSVNNEKQGVENNTNIRAYYAYRIRLKNTTVSFGLNGGGSFYSANYSQLNPYQQNDLNLYNDVKNVFLPNFGTGVYWSASKFYVGLSVPNLLQNYYDKNGPKINDIKARQIRSFYLMCGYVYTVNDVIKLQPQVLARYASNANYSLPFNCDMNLSAIAYDRLMVGATYRTDKSFEAIVHMQVTSKINVGYAFDYMASSLNGYSGGSHEIAVGYDFVREHNKYATPRFIRTF